MGTVGVIERVASVPREVGGPLFGAICQASNLLLAVLDRELRFEYVNANLSRISGPLESVAGRSVEYVWPHWGPNVRIAGERCFATGEPALGIKASMDLFTVEYDVLPIRREGEITGLLVVAQEGAGSDNAATHELAQSRYLLVDVLGRLARMTPESAEIVLPEVLAQMAESHGCQRALVRMITADGDHFVVTHRYDSPDMPPAPVPVDSHLADSGLIERYALGETLVFPNLDSIPPEHAAVRERLAYAGCQAACGVPVVDGSRLLGRVAFLSARPREWNEVHQMRLRLFGEMFGTAYSRVRAEIALRERLHFEETLATASSRLMDVAPESLDAELTATLRAASGALRIERALISLLDEARERFLPTHEWCTPGISSVRRLAGQLSIAEFGWPFTRVMEGEAVRLDLDEIPAEAVQARKGIQEIGMHCAVLVPLTLHGAVIGCVQFHSMRRGVRIPPELLPRLRVIADVIASAIGRRRAAESLRESEVRFTQVIESAPDGVVVLDHAGVVIEWTVQSERLFGRQRHEAIGRRFAELALDAKDQARLALGDGRRLTDGRTEVTGIHKGGRAFPVELSIATMKRSGESIYALFARDITDRKRAEQERQRAFDEVSHQKNRAERERDYLREEAVGAEPILGRSAAIRQALEGLDAVAATNATVLVHGESGVGKELFARALHARSKRASGPLVKVNCASIPGSLFESEFFGHVRGSFTGAHKDRVGRFELADGGTLFLDEVGEIPLEMQAKLLRVLQEGEFERVGDDRTRKVDVRVVAATNRDLSSEVQGGRFRRDLYYRLSVFPIDVPPLRDRSDDVLPLAEHFLSTMSRSSGRSGLELTADHRAALVAYDWPGNIRELQHVIERAVILSPRPPLRLDLALSNRLPSPQSGSRIQASEAQAQILTDDELRKLERDNIVAALDKARGRISGDGGAAEILKVNPSTLRDRMKALGVARRA
jgi:PAS domain S-box-containing protein